MITRGIPREEFISMLYEECGNPVTTIDVLAMLEKYGDLVDGEQVIEHNENRDRFFEEN